MDDEAGGPATSAAGAGVGAGHAPLCSHFSFALAPTFECDAAGLLEAHSFSYGAAVKRDGLLFCCKAGPHRPGPSPLRLRWRDEASSSRRRFALGVDDAESNEATPADAQQGAGGPVVVPARLIVARDNRLSTADGVTLGALRDVGGLGGGGGDAFALGDLVDLRCALPASTPVAGADMADTADGDGGVLFGPAERVRGGAMHADTLSAIQWRAGASAGAVPSLGTLLESSLRR